MNARLTEQLGVVKVAGTLQKSGEVMKLVNRLATVPALAKTVRAMGREMVKAGVIEDMVADAVDGALDDVGVDDEADAEAEAAWRIERQFREWENQTGREEARRSRERAELETANKAVSEYGERRPSRGTGDVFTPYAPRLY